MHGKPESDIDITDALVRQLIREQHPDLGDETLTPVASGWDGVIYRLGESLAVRIPRREIAAGLIRNEQRWLPELAERLPIDVPVPVRIGAPGSGFPWHWSIIPWFPGQCADEAALGEAAVGPFARFIERLHVPAPASAPHNPVRGCSLSVHRERLQQRMDNLASAGVRIAPELLEAWQMGLHLTAPEDKHWLHGDLHAQNVIVENGLIRAVIDWGDLCAGDRAADLASVWSLFDDAGDRHRFWPLVEVDESTHQRAVAWAVYFGVMLLDAGLTNSPRHAEQGRVLLERLANDLRPG